MFFFNVSIYGLPQIDRDIAAKDAYISSNVIPRALERVGAEMIENLQKHIKSDWYKPWGAPLVYVRRTDDPAKSQSAGYALGDRHNMHVSVSGTKLDFTYTPSGESKTGKWAIKSPDALINIIQQNNGWSFAPDLDTKGRHIMPRPFWNNFVDEQIDGGAIMREFRKAIIAEGYKYRSNRGLDIYADGDEKL